MNERAVSTRCAITAAGPTTAPPWLPSAFDRVTVATTSSAPASPSAASSPRPPGPTTPSPCASSTTSSAPRAPAHRVQLAQRGERAVDGVHAVGDDQRALLGAGGEQRVDGGGVVARGDGDAGAGEPAGVDERGVVGRVGDDQRAGAGERGDDAEVGGVARRRTPARPRRRRTRRARPPARRAASVVPVTSREPVEPAPQAPGGRDRAFRPPGGRWTARGSRCPRGPAGARPRRGGAARGAARRRGGWRRGRPARPGGAGSGTPVTTVRPVADRPVPRRQCRPAGARRAAGARPRR